jgi:NTE family protein
MTTVGLVLGAGGIVGQAYHAGVLAALETECGWDPRTADVIVGSSAGSITGTLLRLGVPASDLAALAVGAPLSPQGGALLAKILPDAGALPAPSARSLLRPWRPPSVALVTRVARRPWAFRPHVAALTLMPDGQVDITDRAERLHALVGDRWPDGLWICTVRRNDGARVVFGRPGAPTAPLAAAVLASCAIPGYFTPITIGGVDYFDGGIHSPTNADVLRTQDLDVVIVVSPMSAPDGRASGVDALLRWSTHRRLEYETARLEARGTCVIRLEPGPAARAAMGIRAMSEDRSDRVVLAAYEETKDTATHIPAIIGLARPDYHAQAI